MQKNKLSENLRQSVFLEKDEKILVVKKKILFSYKAIDGLKKVDFENYQKLIANYKEFLWRSKVEHDLTYKQIIPYLVFTYNNKYFLMKRKNNASETRLQNKYSLGIGGHIQKKDLKKTNIIDWAQREFKEEVTYNGTIDIHSLGILNDESDSVGQVHTGFVFLLKGNSSNIQIRNEHKEGKLLSLDQCSFFYNQMERWSQITFDYIKANF